VSVDNACDDGFADDCTALITLSSRHREYNLKNNEVLKDSGGAKVLVCSGGEVDAASSSFVDADGGKILTVDHVKVRSSAAHIRTHTHAHARTHTHTQTIPAPMFTPHLLAGERWEANEIVFFLDSRGKSRGRKVTRQRLGRQPRNCVGLRKER
jgi:hypothetical protein